MAESRTPPPRASWPRPGPSLRGFLIALILTNVGLTVAGILYAIRHQVPAHIAIPIVAAFLWQASVYLVAGFPPARVRLEARLAPGPLALALVVVSVFPYCLYSSWTGLFDLGSFTQLTLLCLAVALPFVLAPTRAQRLVWQDLVVMASAAWPLVSGLDSPLDDIFVSPIPETVPRLDILGKLMLVALGALAFLSLRRIERAGFCFRISRDDLYVGVLHFIYFLPLGFGLGLATGFLQWVPKSPSEWFYWPQLAGTALGVYLVVALPEELFFRGILQNLLGGMLRHPLAPRVVASLLFGLVHIGNRGFPNWRYVLVAAVAGWFYGRAYEQQGNVVAPGVTHTLVVVTWRFLFT